jgi:deoxyribodipyrimidine photo-lyase
MWFRRDLRLSDNAALYHALRSGDAVLPLFIFDKNILDDVEDKTDKRVTFIHHAVAAMQQELVGMQSSLEVYYGYPQQVFTELLQRYTITRVYTNDDYEQYAIDRDSSVEALLMDHGIAFHRYKDYVVFEKNEVMKDDGTPYLVFTPYSKRWKATLNAFYLKAYPTEQYFHAFYKQPAKQLPSLEALGFEMSNDDFPAKSVRDELIQRYDKQRNFPAIPGTSRLSVHLRFGTISIRALATKAQQLNETYLNELIWRDFYQMILWNMPHVRKGFACKPAYDHIKWRNNEKEFAAWCNGVTGYPLVDAGMRELNTTGFMHNRVRMVTASFLCKHLLIDWRWGETYFAKKLIDYDYAANNGGWQWSAGSGCDAAPYFRIFNPRTQAEKFDKDLTYIRQWIPELDSFDYPAPIVDHELARKRCLAVYQEALKRG